MWTSCCIMLPTAGINSCPETFIKSSEFQLQKSFKGSFYAQKQIHRFTTLNLCRDIS